MNVVINPKTISLHEDIVLVPRLIDLPPTLSYQMTPTYDTVNRDDLRVGAMSTGGTSNIVHPGDFVWCS